MTTQNDDMTETVVNAGDTVKTDDIELEAPKNAMVTARRLFVQLGNQRVRLCVVAASILLFTFSISPLRCTAPSWWTRYGMPCRAHGVTAFRSQ